MIKKFAVSLLFFTLCSPAFALEGKVAKNMTPVKEQEMTLGIVQKEIKLGATQDEVALALGSPNIVTRDADGKDTWIYDKVSSIVSYNNNGFGIGGGTVGGGTPGDGVIGGILGVRWGKNKGQVETVQKTLTVVIKFNKKNQVESFTYHMSKF
ncbi:MAG: hypothetical protein KHX03_04405 [Clostridium sp.]|nr:hypothetical protein [Clostridium sp.]